MRIMFFISSMGSGGAERVVSTIANHLIKMGHDVAVATLAHASADFYLLDPRIVRLELGLSTPSSSTMGRALDVLRRIWRLRRELRRFRPQVVVAMVDVSNVLLAIAGLGLRRIVKIGSERSYPPSAIIDPQWAWLRRQTYRWLDGVVAQSGAASRWLRENTTAREVWVIPNPITLPLARSEPIRDAESVRKRPRRILAVGRYQPEKGFDLLIEAFAAAPQSHWEWELIILGEGQERDRLAALVHARELGHVVTLAGLAGNVADWYASADLFVLSSRFEGFPNALLEAMAHGLPVIAFDCLAGPRELLDGGNDGVLVPAEDVQALSVAIAGMTSEAGRRRGYAQRSLAAARKFSVERIAAQWLEIFSGMMRRKVG